LSRLDQRRVWELEPVPVEVLHQDRQQVVLATRGSSAVGQWDSDWLEVGDLVVTRAAYQVYLAWRLQLSGGSGHDHGHEH